MNKSKKIISLLLSLALMLGCFALSGAAFTMPQGISEEQVSGVIPKLTGLMEKLPEITGKDIDPAQMIYSELFSDKTLNAIFEGVYSSFSEQASTFSTLGIDISVGGVREALNGYPEVQSALENKQTWEEVFSGPFEPSWNVKNKAGFGDAVASMFSPMNELLNTLLCSATYRMNLLVSVQGANGYENSIVPILKALGAPHIMNQAEFSAAALQNRRSMVTNVVSMLFEAIDNIFADPVNNLCLYLPSIAWYLENGGLKNSLSTLVEPLKIRVGLIALSGVDKLLENLDVFSSPDDLTKLIEDLDLSGLTGTDADLKLPQVDLAALAECTSFSDGGYNTNKNKSFIVLARWLIEAVKLNADALPSLLGADLSGAKDILDRLLAKDTDSIFKMLVDVLSLGPSDTVLEYSWTYPEFTPGSVDFTPNLTRENYEKVLNEIDATLNEFLEEFTENGTLSGILASRIYSNSLVSELVKGVYGALYTEKTGDMLGILGLDASPEGFAKSISSAYPSAAKAIASASSWDKVNAGSLSWGFSNGSKDGFIKAVTAALSPFAPMLSMLLAGGQISILDTITVSGGNGYNTAVIPILEALGCPSDLIKSYPDYKKTASSGTNAITDILTPLTAVLDSLIEKPVATLCSLLPNIVYFINSDGLSQCVENLLYPVRVLLRTVGADDLLGSELTKLADIDLTDMISTAISDSGLNITLPEPDLELVSSLGTAETLQSKRTYNGGFQTYTYIKADAPQVLVTVLRYVIGALGSGENSSALSSLMSADRTEEGDMMAMYTEKVAAQLSSMTTDETIEWLYDLLFSETPQREKTAEDEYIPTIIFQEKEKHTTRNLTAALIGGAAFIVILSIVLSRIDFSARRDRKKYKKSKKLQEKELIKKYTSKPREGR